MSANLVARQESDEEYLRRIRWDMSKSHTLGYAIPGVTYQQLEDTYDVYTLLCGREPQYGYASPGTVAAITEKFQIYQRFYQRFITTVINSGSPSTSGVTGLRFCNAVIINIHTPVQSECIWWSDVFPPTPEMLDGYYSRFFDL